MRKANQKKDAKLLAKDPSSFWDGITQIGDEFGKIVIGEKWIFSKQGLRKTLKPCERTLTNITIPQHIESIDGGILRKLSNLKSIVVDKNNPYFSSENGFLLSKDGKELLFCPRGKKEINIPASVTTIGEAAFAESQAKEIIIPKNITEIKDYAFSETELEVLSIPDSVSEIDDFAFERAQVNVLMMSEKAIKSHVKPLQKILNAKVSYKGETCSLYSMINGLHEQQVLDQQAVNDLLIDATKLSVDVIETLLDANMTADNLYQYRDKIDLYVAELEKHKTSEYVLKQLKRLRENLTQLIIEELYAESDDLTEQFFDEMDDGDIEELCGYYELLEDILKKMRDENADNEYLKIICRTCDQVAEIIGGKLDEMGYDLMCEMKGFFQDSASWSTTKDIIKNKASLKSSCYRFRDQLDKLVKMCEFVEHFDQLERYNYAIEIVEKTIGILNDKTKYDGEENE